VICLGVTKKCRKKQTYFYGEAQSAVSETKNNTAFRKLKKLANSL
jgi:hypothetical protein